MPLFGFKTEKKRYQPRKHQRVKKPFQVQYSLDGGSTVYPAYPVDISAGGVGILSYDEIKGDQFLVTLTFEAKQVTALVAKAGSVPGKLRGEVAWRTGGKFIGIPADQWDLVQRYVSDQPLEAPEKLKLDLRLLQQRPDDAARLLPKAALDRLLNELVKMKRLAPLQPSVTPLVKLHYLGRTRRQGTDMHALRVESRVILPHRVNNFTTQLYFDDTLTKVVVLPIDTPEG